MEYISNFASSGLVSALPMILVLFSATLFATDQIVMLYENYFEFFTDDIIALCYGFLLTFYGSQFIFVFMIAKTILESGFLEITHSFEESVAGSYSDYATGNIYTLIQNDFASSDYTVCDTYDIARHESVLFGYNIIVRRPYENDYKYVAFYEDEDDLASFGYDMMWVKQNFFAVVWAEIHAKFDENGDGVLSWEEVQIRDSAHAYFLMHEIRSVFQTPDAARVYEHMRDCIIDAVSQISSQYYRLYHLLLEFRKSVMNLFNTNFIYLEMKSYLTVMLEKNPAIKKSIDEVNYEHYSSSLTESAVTAHQMVNTIVDFIVQCTIDFLLLYFISIVSNILHGFNNARTGLLMIFKTSLRYIHYVPQLAMVSGYLIANMELICLGLAGYIVFCDKVGKNGALSALPLPDFVIHLIDLKLSILTAPLQIIESTFAYYAYSTVVQMN